MVVGFKWVDTVVGFGIVEGLVVGFSIIEGLVIGFGIVEGLVVGVVVGCMLQLFGVSQSNISLETETNMLKLMCTISNIGESILSHLARSVPLGPIHVDASIEYIDF